MQKLLKKTESRFEISMSKLVKIDSQ